jgi:hypothetical protein
MQSGLILITLFYDQKRIEIQFISTRDILALIGELEAHASFVTIARIQCTYCFQVVFAAEVVLQE